jgi:hypothetical protein
MFADMLADLDDWDLALYRRRQQGRLQRARRSRASTQSRIDRGADEAEKLEELNREIADAIRRIRITEEEMRSRARVA